MLRLALAAVVLAVPAPALALSCAWGPMDALPPDGTADVPTNAIVRVTYLGGGPDEVPLALVDDEGVEVALTWEPVTDAGGGESVWMATPDAPLQPATAYRLQNGLAEPGDDVEPWVLSAFTTGEGPDTTPPDPPIVLDADRESGRSMWGSSRWNQLVVAPAGEPLYYEVDVASDDRFDEVRTVQVAPWEIEGEHRVDVGSGVCGGSVDLERPDRWMRVRAVDMAGQVSEVAVADRAAGCSALGAPVSGMGLVLGLGLLGLRRRRG